MCKGSERAYETEKGDHQGRCAGARQGQEGGDDFHCVQSAGNYCGPDHDCAGEQNAGRRRGGQPGQADDAFVRDHRGLGRGQRYQRGAHQFESGSQDEGAGGGLWSAGGSQPRDARPAP